MEDKMEKVALRYMLPIIWDEWDYEKAKKEGILIRELEHIRYYKCDCGANIFIPSAYNTITTINVYKCKGCGKIYIGEY